MYSSKLNPQPFYQPYFLPFPRLPTELRRQIWKFVVEAIEPRIVYLQTAHARRNAQVCSPFKSPIPCSSPAPAILHVCREAREVGLSRYTVYLAPPLTPQLFPKTYYLDLRTDLWGLDRYSANHLRDTPGKFGPTPGKGASKLLLNGITSLYDLDEWCLDHRTHSDETFADVTEVCLFISLEMDGRRNCIGLRDNSYDVRAMEISCGREVESLAGEPPWDEMSQAQEHLSLMSEDMGASGTVRRSLVSVVMEGEEDGQGNRVRWRV